MGSVFERIKSRIMKLNYKDIMKTNGNANEKTPIVPLGDPGPSYVFPGRDVPLRERQAKQFQCFICTGIFAAVLIAAIIAICYSFYGPTTENFNPPNDNLPIVNIDGNSTIPEIFFTFFPIVDEPIANWSIPEPSNAELSEAIDAGKKALGDKEMIEEIIVAPALNTPSFRHQRAVSTTSLARIAGKRGYVEDYATRFLALRHKFKKTHIGHNIGVGPLVNLIRNDKFECPKNPKYRTYEGICNNKKHPYWGAAYTPFRRALNPDYCDGVSAPRCAKDGSILPSARDVSVTIHRPSYFTDKHFTVMLAVWGQFLDHDITATASSQGLEGTPIECCNTNQPLHPECFPVALADGDPYYNEFNVTCLNFIRSMPAPTNRLGPRQQYNQASGFIDGSVVYGSTDEKVRSLRSFRDGKLEMYITPDNRTLMPVSRDPNDGCNEEVENSKGRYCFDSGDARANENLHLTSLHLLFARHHNFLAEGLKVVNPHWDDERLFQESRKILGAQMQHITYNEFLSVIIGKEASEKLGILSTPDGVAEDTYDEKLNPTLANEFAAAAFRFAHTLLPGLMKLAKEQENTEESIELHNILFNPYSLYHPNGFDNALRSAMNTSLEKSDPYFTKELTEKLFVHDASPVLCGLDLVSLNIQRGRDHGLKAYPEWRKHCHLTPVDTWEEMEKIIDPISFKRIHEIYKTPNDVDIYTGGLAEYPVKGGIIGPTLTCIVSDQFMRLKRGDSFWYERTAGAQKFTPDQLKQIFDTSLSSVLCRNSDKVEYSQQYVMKKLSVTNPLIKCSDLDSFNFLPWKEGRMGRVSVDDEEMSIKIIKN
ncbi:salivary peroxidase/catechol oxidase [Chironomus tepperi]|uniref:salivary peroxidase/catechol oxidase n=1 Tax=Chironomus tepperi TaxID=113505 RepID=UPI00391F9F74